MKKHFDLSYKFCEKLFSKTYNKLTNYTLQELELISSLREIDDVREHLAQDVAIKLYENHTDFICDNCMSNIDNFYINELLIAIKEIVCECLHQAIYSINSISKP